MGLPNVTYVDKFISDGKNQVLSLDNFYDTILTRDINKEDSIARIPFDDFFIKYREQLKTCIQFYSLPESMFYKPKSLSYELYGTTELWLALLRVNEMRNITEFHLPIIRIYNPGQVKDLISIFFKREKKY